MLLLIAAHAFALFVGVSRWMPSHALEVTLDTDRCSVPIGAKIELKITLKNETSNAILIRKSLGFVPEWGISIRDASGHLLSPIPTAIRDGIIGPFTETKTLLPGQTETYTLESSLHYDAMARTLNEKLVPGLYWNFSSMAFPVPTVEDYYLKYTYQEEELEDTGERGPNAPKMWSGKQESNALKIRLVRDSSYLVEDPIAQGSCAHP